MWWHVPAAEINAYPQRLVRLLMRQAGVEEVANPDDADLACVSVCDITEAHWIRDARVRSGGRIPVLVGGGAAINPGVQALADYTCAGEAYGLARHLAACKSVSDIPNIYGIGHDGKPALIDEYIDWRQTPLLQVTNRAWYYYCGKGCPIKCKYCQMAYSRHGVYAPYPYVQAAARKVPHGGRFYPMVGRWPYDAPPPSNCGNLDMPMTEYIRRAVPGKSPLRFGLECFGEHARREIAKPIPWEDWRGMIAKSAREGRQVAVYLVMGLEPGAAVREMLDNTPVVAGPSTPTITLSHIWFEPQYPTPLYDVDLRTIHDDIDIPRFHRELRNRCTRFRYIGARDRHMATWRAMQSRARERELAMRLLSMSAWPVDKLLRWAESTAPYLLGSTPLGEALQRPRQHIPDIFLS